MFLVRIFALASRTLHMPWKNAYEPLRKVKNTFFERKIFKSSIISILTKHFFEKGGVGVVVYFRKEGRALGEVTKYSSFFSFIHVCTLIFLISFFVSLKKKKIPSL